jgi:hypothetical protein
LLWKHARTQPWCTVTTHLRHPQTTTHITGHSVWAPPPTHHPRSGCVGVCPCMPHRKHRTSGGVLGGCSGDWHKQTEQPVTTRIDRWTLSPISPLTICTHTHQPKQVGSRHIHPSIPPTKELHPGDTQLHHNKDNKRAPHTQEEHLTAVTRPDPLSMCLLLHD